MGQRKILISAVRRERVWCFCKSTKFFVFVFCENVMLWKNEGEKAIRRLKKLNYTLLLPSNLTNEEEISPANGKYFNVVSSFFGFLGCKLTQQMSK